MVEHHSWVALLLLLAFIGAGLAGLFFTFAQAEVTGLREHDEGDQRLRNASGNLLVAYILAYIGAGVLLVLAILYAFQGSLQISEVPHSIIMVVVFATLIISAIFGFIALSDIDESGIKGKNGTGWLWAGEGLLLASVLILILSGAWRFAHVSGEKAKAAEARKAVPAYTETRQTMTFTSPGGMAPPTYAAPTLPMTPATPGGPIIYQ